MASPNQIEQIEELRTMVREADRRRTNYTDPLDFRLWHAECKGRLQAIFGGKPSSLDAWSSLSLVLISEVIEDEDFVIGDEVEPNSWEFIENETDVSFDRYQREEYLGCVQEARRILLDYISLLTSGFIGEIEPATIPTRLDLGFIDDKALQKHCHALYRQTYVCLSKECYDACEYLLGSLLEGILYSVADASRKKVVEAKSAQRDPKTQSVIPLDKWSLAALIDVGTEFGWVRGDTKVHLGLLAKYRNYVHPAKHITHMPLVDKPTVKSHVNAVELCIRDVNDWSNRPPSDD